MPVNPSRQRPRFLKALGNDGLWYQFLLKGKEDLRLDERIMQLFKLINSLFEGNNMMQNLTIRRYPVIPLASFVGLVGMLNNHQTINRFILEYRQDHKIQVYSESNEQRLKMFNDICSQTAARDLYDIIWLNSESTDDWFNSRRNFTRSSAVMSMVGHIIGLGDRHLSNILLERGSSRVVHIDFGDCFEQAMKRGTPPESVPFRLTRMMINAFELGGYKGVYQQTCEQTMQLLRKNKDGIMAMLEAFILDPLSGCFKQEDNKQQQMHLQKEIITKVFIYEENAYDDYDDEEDDEDEDQRWNSNKNNSTQSSKYFNRTDGESMFGQLVSRSSSISGVFGNEANRHDIGAQAKQSISCIERKLKGFKFGGEFMAIKKQVTDLIQKASSCENLSNMYLGWMPFW
ncbi:MAG: putative Serine/threonine-protein kinase tor [Streblomastix strix]|uniref:non-specific serine/threonine protein kinase n=1 Tax=Streblomastix strix TaxID=222440 RepID=A0A5J4V1N5_9EUKA|nr:MAG: putative Serine/threonine-protein kinase tor [Streblomastix strix]